MKNTARYLLAMSLLLFWSTLSADGVIKNGAKIKLKKGTHLIEKGSIIIDANAQLIVEGMTTINGSLTNNNEFSGIQIKSNAEYTGSLIYEDGSPKAEVELYMKTRRNHFVASPVSGEVAGTLDFNGNPQTWLFSHTDATGLSVINNNEEILNSGQGYYYRTLSNASGDITPVFEGNLASTDLALDNASVPALSFSSRGTNLVANPYSCAINWDHESITSSNLEGSIWIYDSKKRKYKYRNNSGYGNFIDGIIPMGQAFIIRALNNNASLTIPKEARIHADQAVFKDAETINEDLSFVIFEVAIDTLSDELWVGYQWDSSDEFDNGIDITKMFSFEDDPQLYTAHNDLELCVDIVAEPQESGKTVPINFIAGSAGIHRINLLSWQGFEDTDVFLEDLFTGELMDVKEMDFYEFNAQVGDEVERFLLHFSTTVSTEEINHQSNVNIYAYQNTIYINSDGIYARQDKKVLIYDVNGKQLAEVFVPAGKMQQIENFYQRKVLIIKAIYPQQIFTRKILNF